MKKRIIAVFTLLLILSGVVVGGVSFNKPVYVAGDEMPMPPIVWSIELS